MDKTITLRHASAAAILVALTNLAGCAAVKGIFKAGMWVGVVAVLFFVAVGALIARTAKG